MLRIGGDTSDWSWVPVPHMKRPLGVRINLDRTWLQVMSGLSRAVDARLILGINLEANNRRLTRYEARTFLQRIGKQSIAALELGNEPELYGSLAWFVLHHRRYYGRPHGYDYRRLSARRQADARGAADLSARRTGGRLSEVDRLHAALPSRRRAATVDRHRPPLSASAMLQAAVLGVVSDRRPSICAEGPAEGWQTAWLRRSQRPIAIAC